MKKDIFKKILTVNNKCDIIKYPVKMFVGTPANKFEGCYERYSLIEKWGDSFGM
jgi:hypothetical protein